MAYRFIAVLDIIGVNPFVHVPETILNKLFKDAGRVAGPIPVRGTVNGKAYTQTLVRYRGAWRLYINLIMLPASPKRVGEELSLSIEYDPADRSIALHQALEAALAADSGAKAVLDALPPSRRKEILRYIAALKSDEAVSRNVARAIDFLNGKGRFIGRDRP